jgi:uncharacterized lipoprotein YddW (UPF0748 family)
LLKSQLIHAIFVVKSARNATCASVASGRAEYKAFPLLVRFPSIFPSAFLLLALVSTGLTQEFRAMWADTFHAGLRNSSETSALIAAARAANCNAVMVEIRRRGDAYYQNGLEPVATDVAAGFDPLADLITKGHDTSGGEQRIEVHAWFVTYNIWNYETIPPSQPTHPYNLHPEWLSQNNLGETWDGNNYQFDQGHPSVQQHNYNVIMDVLSRYNVDGIHFDYIRYSDGGSSGGYQPWGYHPVSVARFKTQTGTSVTPLPDNAAWLQWRRDQVTALVRKVYLNAWATKPSVRVSASLICYDPAPTLTASSWLTSAAYSRVLQDWRGWLEEGILDLGCPMNYKTGNTSFTNWTSFIRERQYNRAAAIGMGWYLNSISNTITQIGIARGVSTGGLKAVGVLGYSYAAPDSNAGTSQNDVWSALTAGPFPTTVSVPSMPWKTDTTKGHLMTTLVDSATNIPLDGATVMISGPASRTLKADATGFFGAAALPVGTYTLTINLPGYRSVTKTVTITGAQVAQPNIVVERLPFIITNSVRNPVSNTLTITWNSLPGKTYRVERSQNLVQWTTVVVNLPSGGGSTSYMWQYPSGSTEVFLRAIEEN